MKRILVLLSVVALMMAMLAVTVAPVFAHNVECTGKGILTGTTPGANGDSDFDGWICFNPNSGKYQDDHGVGGH